MTDWRAAQAAAETVAAGWSGDAPGGAVIGFDAEGVRFSIAAGLESLATRAPFTDRSVGRFASVTKHVFCAMVLEHADRMPLEAPIGDFLPELSDPLAGVTVGRALAMTGGIPDTRECLALHGLTTASQTRADALLAYMARLDRLNFPPGTQLSYSNGGYRLVEAALGRLGHRFDDFVRDRVSGPLDLGLRTLDYWQETVPGLVAGHARIDGAWQETAQGMHLSSAGSLVGSLDDLVAWIRSGMLGHWPRLTAPRPLADGRLTGYGLGMRWSRLGDRRLVGHGGSQPGFRSYFLVEPETGAGVAVLGNRDDCDAYRIALAVLARRLVATNSRPVAANWSPPGLYVSEDNRLWAETHPSSITILGSEEPLFASEDGWAVSNSSSSPIRLRWTGEALEGEIGHAACRLHPVRSAPAPDLDGLWLAREEGACFEIDGDRMHWGMAAQRQSVPIVPLSGSASLFELSDGPARRRVLMRRLGSDTIELATDRARMIRYRRLRDLPR